MQTHGLWRVTPSLKESDVTVKEFAAATIERFEQPATHPSTDTPLTPPARKTDSPTTMP